MGEVRMMISVNIYFCGSPNRITKWTRYGNEGRKDSVLIQELNSGKWVCKYKKNRVPFGNCVNFPVRCRRNACL
jgi:hypothetical protein